MRYVRLFPIALLPLLLLFLGESAGADGPFTPTFSLTLDEVAPDDPDILPTDDECPVGAACKFLWWTEIPDGQPAAGIFGEFPPSIVGLAADALVPDGAIVGKVVGSEREGPVGSCATEGTIVPFELTWLDATTDASTTTGSAADLCSFSNWPTQLDGVMDDILAAVPGATLNARWVGCSPTLTTNVLLFAQTDGSILYTVRVGDPTAPPPFEICGPWVAKSVHLGISADNLDTPEDEGGIPLRTCTADGTQTFGVYLDRSDTPLYDPLILGDTAVCSPNTSAGNDVSVPLNGGTEALGGMDVTFSEVVSGGTTTVEITQGGPPPPAGFNVVGLGGVPLYFDISTTASFTGDVEVCTRYNDTGLTAQQEAGLQLLQYDGEDWVDRTSSIDTADNIICGTAPSFSTWAVTAPAAAGPPVVGGTVGLIMAPDAPPVSSKGSDDSKALMVVLGVSAIAALSAVSWYAGRRWLE